MNDYLISKKDMRKRGWDEVDFVYVCGDAYVDHPSFGHAIITRLLEAHGYRVGDHCPAGLEEKESIAWSTASQGLAFLVSAGNMDSMVNHYSVSKKQRKNRCLYAGRRYGKTAGLCSGGILQSDPAGL